MDTGKTKVAVSGSSSIEATEEVPVPACQGYHCHFCDRSFSDWIDVEQETLQEIPAKPGICVIGLLNCALDLYGRNVSEILDVVIDGSDVQKAVSRSIDHARDHVEKKKAKHSIIPYEYVIQCKWVVYESFDEDGVASFVAHWNNNDRFLPTFLAEWPGMEILITKENFTFSEILQKWCFRRQNDQSP